jgi:hypothetical protein
MKKQIKSVLVAIAGIIAIGFLTGCASGPKFGTPTRFQAELNELAEKVPINIAGKSVKLSFEGDLWRGKVDGNDVLAGDAMIVQTPDGGATLTLNQTWAFVDTGKKVPLTGKPVAKWQKMSGPQIILEYKAGPPATLTAK